MERGSEVERTRAPRSAREEAAETRPWKPAEIESEEGRRGPVGPQRRRSLTGLFLQSSRPDQSLCCCFVEEVEEEEEMVREREERELEGKEQRLIFNILIILLLLLSSQPQCLHHSHSHTHTLLSFVYYEVKAVYFRRIYANRQKNCHLCFDFKETKSPIKIHSEAMFNFVLIEMKNYHLLFEVKTQLLLDNSFAKRILTIQCQILPHKLLLSDMSDRETEKNEATKRVTNSQAYITSPPIICCEDFC